MLLWDFEGLNAALYFGGWPSVSSVQCCFSFSAGAVVLVIFWIMFALSLNISLICAIEDSSFSIVMLLAPPVLKMNIKLNLIVLVYIMVLLYFSSNFILSCIRYKFYRRAAVSSFMSAFSLFQQTHNVSRRAMLSFRDPFRFFNLLSSWPLST